MWVLQKNTPVDRMNASSTNDTASATEPCPARISRQLGTSIHHFTHRLAWCVVRRTEPS